MNKILFKTLFAITLIIFAYSCKKDNTGINTGEFTIQVESGRCGNTVIAGTFEEGVPLDDDNYATFFVNVTKTGDYTISLSEINGYTFSSTGTFSDLGEQQLKLYGKGTPETFGKDTFDIDFGGATCNFTVTVKRGTDIEQANKIIITAGNDFFENNYFAIALDGYGNKLWTSPGICYDASIDNGILYIDKSHGMAALKIETGEVLWSNTYDENAEGATISNNVIYSQTSSGSLYAVNATNGSLIWSYSVGGSVISSIPTVYNNVIYFGANEVYAITADGTLKWNTSFNSSFFRSSPAVVNGIAYIGNDSGIFYALNADDGSEIWAYNVGMTGEESPFVYDGKVYIGGSKLYCFDALTGSVIWDKNISTGWSQAVIENGILYVPGSSSLNALNPLTGEIIWTVSEGYTTNDLTYSNGYLYYGRGGFILARHADDGDFYWNYGDYTKGSYINLTMPIIVYDKVTKEVNYSTLSGMRQ